MTQIECQSCGHKILGPGVRLSSIEFRRKINSITSIKEIEDCKDYLIQFVKNRFRLKESVKKFLDELEDQFIIDSPIDAIKTWILEYYDTEGRRPLLGNNPESPLYDLLRLKYSTGINMSFSDFYQDYTNTVNSPLSKNCVSRALNALGIKPIMKKVKSGDKETKCTMMVCVTKEKLSEVLKKNGLLC